MLLTFRDHKNCSINLPLTLQILAFNYHQEPIYRPKGLPVYQWFYCVDGKGEFIVGNRQTIIGKGYGVLIYPQIPHSYHALTSDWIVDIFGFSGSNCTNLLKTLRMNDLYTYRFINTDIFPEHIHNLYYLKERKMKNKLTEYSKECYNFLIDISLSAKKINPFAPRSGSKLLQKIIDYLETHYSQDLSLDDLADHLQLSKGYLCVFFKENMQQTIGHYLLSVRIHHAQVLLIQYPEKKIFEIAQMCGFKDSSYFCKIFKRELGTSPESYRKGLF